MFCHYYEYGPVCTLWSRRLFKISELSRKAGGKAKINYIRYFIHSLFRWLRAESNPNHYYSHAFIKISHKIWLSVTFFHRHSSFHSTSDNFPVISNRKISPTHTSCIIFTHFSLKNNKTVAGKLIFHRQPNSISSFLPLKNHESIKPSNKSQSRSIRLPIQIRIQWAMHWGGGAECNIIQILILDKTNYTRYTNFKEDHNSP